MLLHNSERMATNASCKIQDFNSTAVIERIEKHVKMASKTLIIYGVIAMTLLAIFGYCVYNIVDIVQFYNSQKQTLQSSTDTKDSRAKTSDPTNPGDDNEHYVNSDDALNAENNDEYLQYTQQINKSISEFKNYNEKMKAFYRENKPGESAPDLIDKAVLLKESDNY